MKTITVEVDELVSTLSEEGVQWQLSMFPVAYYQAEVNYVDLSATVHLEQAEFKVKAHENGNISAQAKLGIPVKFGSCSTAHIADYITELRLAGTALRCNGNSPASIRQGLDDRTRVLLTCLLTYREQVAQGVTHALQISNFGFDLRQTLSGDRPNLFPVRTVLERQQTGYFVEREAETLRPLDKLNPINQRDWVLTKTACARRNRQQRALLVIADRLNTNSSRLGEAANRQCLTHGKNFETLRKVFDSVARYGVYIHLTETRNSGDQR